MAYTGKEKRFIKRVVSIILELHKCYTREDIDAIFSRDKEFDIEDRIQTLYMAIPREFEWGKDNTLDNDSEYLLAVGAFLKADINRRQIPVNLLTDFVIQDLYSHGEERLFSREKDREDCICKECQCNVCGRNVPQIPPPGYVEEFSPCPGCYECDGPVTGCDCGDDEEEE